MYITTTEQLTEAVASLSRCAEVAIDTEFMREKTYYAKLCLVQIAGGEETYLIDPLQGMNLEPLGALLANRDIVKIFHAGSQDLEIFYQLFGSATAPVFDTQPASALIGYPEQISYGALVAGECDVKLEKGDSFTDWARRPLTATQVEYARNDVVYLLKMYPSLLAKIAEAGRSGWLDDDFARMADPATYEIDFTQLWRKVKRVSSLAPRALAIVSEIAAFREREAMRRNLPKRWVLSDETIVQIAHRKPTSRAELEQIRGITKVATSRADEVLAGVARAMALPDAELPSVKRTARPTFDMDPGVDLVVALVRQRAKDHNIAMTQLATRAQLEEFVRSRGEAGALTEGWRHAMVGADAKALVDGSATLSLRDGVLVLTPTAPEER